MTPEEQWMSIYDHAGALKAAYGTEATSGGIRGRFIVVLVNKLCEFWEKHKDTLIPFLSQLAIAALEAIVTQRSQIATVNDPGPR